MPGPHLWEGEKSLDLSAPAFKARKILPRSTLDAGPVERSVQRPSKITKTTSASHFAGSTKSPLGSPIILTGDTALPPTPPPNARDTHNQYNVPLAPPGHGLGVITSLASKGSGLSTPTNGRSPPTPDTTPPSATARRRRPALPSPFSSATSRAESFQTAKEQWSSDDDTASMHSWRDGHHTSAHAFVEATRALRHGDRGLGFEFEQQDDGEVTPTQDRTRRLQVPPMATKLNGHGRQIETNRIGSLANREPATEPAVWDENLMRNVTLRRAKRPRSPPRQQPTAPNLDFIRIEQSPLLTPLLEDFDSRQQQLVRTPPMAFARPRAASGAANATTDSFSDPDGKRSSGMSSSSTIVEAVIRVSNTPSRAKTLKHVKKYTGLRNFSETSIEMSSTSLINHHKRDSTNSDDAPPRKLSHKRGSVGNNAHRESLSSEADNAASAPSPRRPLKHHRDYSHLRSETVSSTATAMSVDASPKKATQD